MINGGGKGFKVSNDTFVTGARLFPSASLDAGFRPQESSRHTMARIRRTWGRTIIEGKAIINKQKKNPLPYFQSFYCCPFFRCLIFLS